MSANDDPSHEDTSVALRRPGDNSATRVSSMNVDDDSSHGSGALQRLARGSSMDDDAIVRAHVAEHVTKLLQQAKGASVPWDEDELFPTRRATPEQVAAVLRQARADVKTAEAARRASGL